MDVKKDINDWVENKVNHIFNVVLKESYSSSRNNLSSNDLDLLITDGIKNLKVDAQYSFNFEKYGDVRIDLMSAGIRKEAWKSCSVVDMNRILEKSENPYAKLEEMFDIKKKGKYFTDKDNLGVFYFLYNEQKPKDLNLEKLQSTKIDGMVFIPAETIYDELKQHSSNHVYKINDKTKNGLSEQHDSAFICLNVKSLCKKYSIPLYSTREDLKIKLYDYFDSSFKSKVTNKLVNRF